jgi:hypothetical protein
MRDCVAGSWLAVCRRCSVTIDVRIFHFTQLSASQPACALPIIVVADPLPETVLLASLDPYFLVTASSSLVTLA